MFYVIKVDCEYDYIEASNNVEALSKAKIDTSDYFEMWVATPMSKEKFFNRLDFEYNSMRRARLHYDTRECAKASYEAYIWYYNKGLWRTPEETLIELNKPIDLRRRSSVVPQYCFQEALINILGI